MHLFNGDSAVLTHGQYSEVSIVMGDWGPAIGSVVCIPMSFFFTEPPLGSQEQFKVG